MSTNATPADAVKVLFIAGSGRSGSTILDNILGQVDGFFSVGELRYIWERGFVEGRPCACGHTVQECPFWSRALTIAYGDPASVDPRRMMTLQQRGTRVRHIPRMVRGEASGRRLVAGMAGYPDAMGRLYAAVREASGCSIVVDSSKLPSYGFVISKVPQVDLRVLHLVRDPRAAAYSWQRRKPAPDRSDGVMQRQSPAHSAALWTVWNWTASSLWSSDPSRYMRIRYEDLVRSPQPILRRILSFVEEPARSLPFTDETTVDLEPTHSVAGNPSRFSTGRVVLSPDDEWRTNMPASQRLLVSAVSSPMLHRFGYHASH